MQIIQKITPHFWFDSNAAEAVNFYVSIFKNSDIGKTSYYGKAGQETHQMPIGSVLAIQFTLDGQQFVAINGGPVFEFTEAVSFMVNCNTQEEIDFYWSRLSAGGDVKAQQCGWLKDKFGLSWQVTPTILADMLSDPDKEKAGKVMEVMMKMKKLDIEALQKAYDSAEVTERASQN